MDRFGRVLNVGDRDVMTPLGRRVARALSEAYRARLGAALHSVYLTGAASRGRSGPIEAVGVLRMTASCVGRGWLEEVAGSVRARWPGAGRPALQLLDWRHVFPDDETFSPTRFRLGVNSVCLTGRDVTRTIPPQRLSVSASNAWIVHTRERLAESRARIDLVSKDEDIKREAFEVGRFLLSAGFAMVMAHEGVYTEDADLQRDFLMLNHPERENEIWTAYEFAVAPSPSAGEVLRLLDGYGRWFEAECDGWLDRHNPQRAATLPA